MMKKTILPLQLLVAPDKNDPPPSTRAHLARITGVEPAGTVVQRFAAALDAPS